MIDIDNDTNTVDYRFLFAECSAFCLPPLLPRWNKKIPLPSCSTAVIARQMRSRFWKLHPGRSARSTPDIPVKSSGNHVHRACKVMSMYISCMYIIWQLYVSYMYILWTSRYILSCFQCRLYRIISFHIIYNIM